MAPSNNVLLRPLLIAPRKQVLWRRCFGRRQGRRWRRQVLWRRCLGPISTDSPRKRLHRFWKRRRLHHPRWRLWRPSTRLRPSYPIPVRLRVVCLLCVARHHVDAKPSKRLCIETRNPPIRILFARERDERDFLPRLLLCMRGLCRVSHIE